MTEVDEDVIMVQFPAPAVNYFNFLRGVKLRWISEFEEDKQTRKASNSNEY